MKIGYDYDDILLVPQTSEINSRINVHVGTTIMPGIELDIPIVAAPMLSICEHKMCIKMHEIGGLGILHRFMSIARMRNELDIMCKNIPKHKVAFAIGVSEHGLQAIKTFANIAGIICIDVNIGQHVKVTRMIHKIKSDFPELKIIAGNVSTREGAKLLCDAGADCIRATNGGGAVCSTLDVTGVGIPTATSLEYCHLGIQDYMRQSPGKHIGLIADGGHKNSGSMVKALAIGADAVMIGSLIAGSSSCPESAFFIENGEFKAKYSGMASEEAQRERGGLKAGTAPEGISQTIAIKGKTKLIVQQLVGGIRSGMSFCNAPDVKALQQNALFIRKYSRH